MAIRRANPGNVQSVLDGAVAGDVVELDSGEYHLQVNVRKPVTLRSASGLGARMFGSTQRGYPAVFLTGCGAAIVERVAAVNPVGSGVQFNDGAVGAIVRDSLFERCGHMGCLVQRTVDVKVLNNEFAWCGNDITLDPHTDRPGTGLHSIYYGGGTGPRALRGLIEGNWIHDSQNGGALQIGGCAEDLVCRRNTIQRVIAPAQYAADIAGIQVFSSYLGVDRILVEENIVEDCPGWGYTSRAWEQTARAQATFKNNAARRCGKGAQETVYGTKTWAVWGVMFANLPDWKLDAKAVPAGDSPLIGLVSPGVAIGAKQPTGTPPPPDPDPTLTITSNLTAGQVIKGSIPWNAVVSGGVPSEVRFYVDGALKTTEKIAPYDFGGTPDGKLDTTVLLEGAHTLRIEAGAASLEFVVTVDNVTEPPPNPDTLPLTILSETSTTVTVGWTPPAGAVGYRFRKDGGNWSLSWNGSLSSTRFSKPYVKLEVEALSSLAKGDIP